MSKLRAGAILGFGVFLGLVCWATGATPVAMSEAPRLRAAGRGRPWVNLGDAASQTYSFRNAGVAAEKPLLDGASPAAAAVGDLDRDGVPDVLVALATRDGGVLALYFGHPGAMASESDSPPFRGEAYLHPVAVRPDFVAAGDFDADGDVDAVVATRGTALLVFLEGDGRGGFGPARTIGLQGGVTAIAAGEINRPDGLQDLAVAVDSPTSASLLVFESPRGALSGDAPEIVPLPSRANDLALGRFHDSVARDVAVAARTGLVVVEGRDRKLSLPSDMRSGVPSARLVVLDVPGGLQAVAAGEFSPPDAAEGDGRRYDLEEIAALDSGGRLLLAALEDGEVGARRFATRALPVEATHFGSVTAFPAGTRLVRGRISSLGGDDLLLVDRPGRRIVALHPAGGADAMTEQNFTAVKSLTSLVFDAEGTPIIAIPMRLNADGQDDLVVFEKESPTPVVALSAPVATFTVNTIYDYYDPNIGDGICNSPCSLRAAIENANFNAGADLIQFALNSGTPFLSQPVPLPALTGPVTILGDTGGATRTQIGRGLPPFSGVLLKFGSGAQGSVIRKLTLSQSRGGCLQVSSADTRVEGCWIGLNAEGGHGDAGCGGESLPIGGARVIVGGTTIATRNVIANPGTGTWVMIVYGTGTAVQGNYIGTDVTGMLSGVGDGVQFQDWAAGGLVGGPTATPGEPPGNLLAKPVYAVGRNQGLLVQGNMSGLKADGFTPIGGGGVYVLEDSRGATIGGSSASLRNVISGKNGVVFLAFSTLPQTDVLVQGNWIGLTRDGSANAGNDAEGIYLFSNSKVTIGGVAAAPGEPPGNVISGNLGDGIWFWRNSIDNAILGNRIAFNGLSGIRAPDNGTLRNVFRGNSIVGNGALGIDLGPSGVTPNDAGDGDAGPNELQNFPVIEHADFDGAATRVEGRLESRPSATFVVEVFSNPSGRDPSGHGQGESPVGEVMTATDASGLARFVLTVPGEIAFPTAVARDSAGNTSEFSSAFANPGEASPQELRASRGGFSRVALSYAPACFAKDHAVYAGVAGSQGIAGELSWSASFCGLGTGGATSFDPGDPPPGSLIYFVIVGQSESREGSYGRDSTGAQRAEAIGVGDCDRIRALGATCP